MVRVKRNRLTSTTWLVAAALGIAGALACGSAARIALAADVEQQVFASPEEAVDALVAAARAERPADLLKVFGPEGKAIVNSGDPAADKAGRARFVAGYDKRHKIVKEGDNKAVLVLREDDWPMPIPIVKQANAWRFDTAAGKQEILDRRIGRNELGAIEVCRAIVDAQREYATKDLAGTGLLEFAQRFVSRPGKHDGLYWETAADAASSPLGPLVAGAQPQGDVAVGERRRRAPYHGYYYRMLKRQGANAPGGAHDYVANGHMIGGFAVVAYPAQYGASGIMSFIVNHEGVVYEKNLGPDSTAIARDMEDFDPDASWKKP